MLPVQLRESNRTEVDYPRDSTIADQFNQQVARTPDAIAVVAKDSQLSYRELDERSNRLARHLQTLGVKPETLVGISIGRSETLVVSLLAILKAGAAYVPLDPTHPKERLSLVIEDSEMQILLTTSETQGRLPFGGSGVTAINVENPAIAHESPYEVTSNTTSHNLAYVIYTSGSTGKPKGVMIENRNVINFFTGMDRAIGCAPGVWLAVTSFSFDISVLELLWALTRGFKVVVHGDEGTATIANEITRHGVTHLQMTPSLARMLTLDARAFASLGLLKQMLLGGEAVPASLIHHIRQVFSGEIQNMYGPTETTIWSTTYRVEEPGSTVSIGRPISIPRSTYWTRNCSLFPLVKLESSSLAETAWPAVIGIGPTLLPSAFSQSLHCHRVASIAPETLRVFCRTGTSNFLAAPTIRLSFVATA